MIISRQPGVSLQSLLIGNKVFTIPEMVALKLGIGCFASVIIVSLCALATRCWSASLIVTVILVQLIWIEYEWGFSFSANDIAEALVRVAEEFGVVVSGLVFYGFLSQRIQMKNQGRGE